MVLSWKPHRLEDLSKMSSKLLYLICGLLLLVQSTHSLLKDVIHSHHSCPPDYDQTILTAINTNRAGKGYRSLELNAYIKEAAKAAAYQSDHAPNVSPFGEIRFQWSTDSPTNLATIAAQLARTLTPANIIPGKGKPRYNEQMWAAVRYTGIACLGLKRLVLGQRTLRLVIMFQYPTAVPPPLPPITRKPKVDNPVLQGPVDFWLPTFNCPAEFSDQLITIINAFRRDQSLPPVQYSVELSKAAQRWVNPRLQMMILFRKGKTNYRPKQTTYGHLYWLRWWDWKDASGMNRFAVNPIEPFKENWITLPPFVKGLRMPTVLDSNGTFRNYTQAEWANVKHVGVGVSLQKVFVGVALQLELFFDGVQVERSSQRNVVSVVSAGRY